MRDEAGKRGEEYEEREQRKEETIGKRCGKAAEVVLADLLDDLLRDARRPGVADCDSWQCQLRQGRGPSRIEHHETMSFRWNHHQATRRKAIT
jgi:hypothetical protein